MKTTKGAKTDRRERRTRRDHAKGSKRANDDLRLTPLGGPMAPDLVARMLEGARGIDFDAPFADLAPRILPALKRVWHPYPDDLLPFHVSLPPGIPTGFCIDFGPGFSHVTEDMLERWDVDVSTLLATALDNLRTVAVIEPPVIQRFRHDDVDVVAIQGQGWGSALILAPDVLGPLIGASSRLLMTPVRNAVLALPANVDPEVAKLLWWALADGAHDVLDVDPLLWTGSDVASIRAGEPSGLPN